MRAWAMRWIAGLWRPSSWRTPGLGLAAGLFTASCVLSEVDLEGRSCPCAEGWFCGADNRCYEGNGPLADGGRRDAGTDAGSVSDGGGRFDAGEEPVERDAGEDIDAGTDAGTFDAGTDAGPRDAGTDAPPPPVDAGPGNTRCDDIHSGALFCDGFEWSYPGGRMEWVRDDVTGGNVNTVTSPAPFLGQRSMRAQTTTMTEGNQAAMAGLLGSAISSGDIWLRGMFFLPSAQQVTSISLLYVGDVNGNQGIAIQTYDGGLAAVWIGTVTNSWRALGVSIPRNQWACLELHVAVNDTSGAVEVFINGGEPVRFTNIDTLPVVGGYILLKAGIEYQNGLQPPATLYADEVVLSRTRVGCQ